ncbi:MAG TPA: ABC transporter ATP-binding protein/permease [Roseiarcus sp.]|jgi:putative ATP-binding cassette transporter|nr:ABC transporter ATP-binding protein/permease [Roseiarcus sp.]
MRMLSLAVFAAVALVIGAYEEDGMMLLIGVASAGAAAASLPRFRTSLFLSVLSDLFAIETIAFGVADIISLVGYWPPDYAAYSLPRYLPLATAIFGVVIFGISYFPFVQRMLRITDPFFLARTPISIRPWPLPGMAVRQSLYARINVFFLILINQFQVALGVRLNFFYRAFGNAIQIPDAAHMDEFWRQLLWVFCPLVTISILAFLLEFYVSLNFVLQWRRWMTASYTSRWLLHAMHYQLAVRGGQADNPDQRISEDIGGFISGEGGRGNSMNVGIYNYTIQAMTTATNLVAFSIILWGLSGVMDPTIFGVTIHGFLFWVAVLYACFATGMMQLIGRSLSRLMFRQQAVEANFRFDLARIREFSEQIALLKGEDREIDRAGRVFNDIFTTVQRIIRVRTFLNSFLQFYTQISAIIPYVVVAPFYFVVKKVDFGTFSQAADAFSNVNSAMNFFVNQYTGLAAFSATIRRLTSFEEAFARARADEEKKPRIEVAAGSGPILSIPDLDLKLPDGRKLAHVGDLALIPQEPALFVGPTGVGKSTLFRAIAGIWSFGRGEILQPPYAKLMLLPQRPYIPIGPLREALAYPAASSTYSDEKLRETLKMVDLGAFADRLDESENWQMRLSGGEQQRVGVARALLAKPDWLFLDEATASLDDKSEADLYRMIAKTLPKTTLVSIGHRSTLTAFHKRRIVFEPQEGKPATLASAEGVA